MPTWNVKHKPQAAFFDADGTLLSFTTHTIPASTKEALHALREHGIMCFLATGRPPYQVDMIDIADMEAFILFNGQFILDRNGVFFQQTIDKKDVATVVEQVHQGLYEAAFMNAERAYVSGYNELVENSCRQANIHFPVDDIDKALGDDIYQMNLFLRPGETAVVRDNTKQLKLTRWSPNFVDAFPLCGGKAHGVQRICERYHIPCEKTIAFGDGGNDLEMFDVVGMSVALGNANPKVKEEADFVTDDVDHAGIWNACVRLGLIAGDIRTE